MRRILIPAIVLIFAASAAGGHDISSEAKVTLPFGKGTELDQVERVLQGNALELASGEQIRLIGVGVPDQDDPEKNAKNAERLGIPIKKFEKFSKKSRDFLKHLVRKNDVYLTLDDTNAAVHHRDELGRKMVYAYGLERKKEYVQFSTALQPRYYEEREKNRYHLHVNATMIQAGYAFVEMKYPFRSLELFRKLEREAKENKRGIWK